MKKIISGVLLLDKPIDISSHQAVSQAKRLMMSDEFDSKKAGHTGTLDPMATGLLPICFGEATKFSQYGLDANKGYEATLQLGVATDTGDKMGGIIGTAKIREFADDELQSIATSMIGEQSQIPPMYSALKKDGKKLYEYARQGIDVHREARPITIHDLTLTKIDNNHIHLSVRCSKGTYVRTLGEDIAKRLGTLGHLTSLRRVMTGGFDVKEAITVADFESLSLSQRFDRLLPIDVMLMHFPIMQLDDVQTQRIHMGQRLNVRNKLAELPTDVFAPDNLATKIALVRLYHDEHFVGLAEVEQSGRLQPKKLVAL